MLFLRNAKCVAGICSYSARPASDPSYDYCAGITSVTGNGCSGPIRKFVAL